MTRCIVLLVCGFAFSQCVMARIGETIPECTQRYGDAVTNYPGLDAVNQYVKNDITITIWFVKSGYGAARAGMVLYTRVPAGELPSYNEKKLSEEERNGLLSTVQGKWEPYKKPDQLAGRPTQMISMGTSPGIMETRRDQVKQTLENALLAQFPSPLLGNVKYYIKDIGYNGSQLYAFEAMYGLAIGS